MILKCGRLELPWEIFAAFLLSFSRSPDLEIPSRLNEFVKAVAHMRSPDCADPPRDWLDLALRFRQRVASRPRDKLFALLRLLKSLPNQEILESCVSTDDKEFFAALSRNYLMRTNDLSLLVLAEGREIRLCS